MKKFLLLFLPVAITVILLGCNSEETTQETNPDSTSVAPVTNQLYKKYNLDQVKLPPGFSISVFAEVPNARSMCWGEQGTLFAGNRDKDKVYAITDKNKDGKADSVYVVDEKLNMPCGVAFRNGSLYVAEVNRILRYDSIEARLSN